MGTDDAGTEKSPRGERRAARRRWRDERGRLMETRFALLMLSYSRMQSTRALRLRAFRLGAAVTKPREIEMQGRALRASGEGSRTWEADMSILEDASSVGVR